MRRGINAENQTEQQTDGVGREREKECRTDALGDDVRHTAAAHNAVTQIALKNLPQPLEILHINGVVESQCILCRLNVLHGQLRVNHRLQRRAGRDFHDEKRQQRDAEKNRNHLQQTFEHIVAAHKGTHFPQGFQTCVTSSSDATLSADKSMSADSRRFLGGVSPRWNYFVKEGRFTRLLRLLMTTPSIVPFATQTVFFSTNGKSSALSSM